MRALATVTTQEVLRFCRRRETLWLLLSVGLVFTAPLVVLAFQGPPSLSTFGPRRNFLWACDELRGALRLAENCLLFLFALGMSRYAVRHEIDNGSWSLLRQTPLAPEILFLGKLAGVALLTLLLHSFCYLFLALWIPVVNQSAGELVIEYLFALVVVIGTLPELFLTGVVRGKRTAVYPLVASARLVILAFLISLFLPAPVAPRMWASMELLVAWYADALSPASAFTHPMEAIVAGLAFWLVSSCMVLVLSPRRGLFASRV